MVSVRSVLLTSYPPVQTYGVSSREPTISHLAQCGHAADLHLQRHFQFGLKVRFGAVLAFCRQEAGCFEQEGGNQEIKIRIGLESVSPDLTILLFKNLLNSCSERTPI